MLMYKLAILVFEIQHMDYFSKFSFVIIYFIYFFFYSEARSLKCTEVFH